MYKKINATYVRFLIAEMKQIWRKRLTTKTKKKYALRTQYKAHYRLALQLACQNRVNSALKSVQKALSLNADCGPAFLLLQLLFSVDAKAPVVLEGATCGLRRWPNLAGFHVLSAKLMIESGNSAGALEICRDWIQQVYWNFCAVFLEESLQFQDILKIQ